MDKVNLTIDGQKITAGKGQTILEVALERDIYIPNLCYHSDLEPVGVCRLCMVEIEGKGQVISCKTTAEEGMAVKTRSEQVDKIRQIALELLIANQDEDYITALDESKSELARIAVHVGVNKDRLKRLRRPLKGFSIDDSNPFFKRDPNKCILCGICVRTCEELQRVSGIDFAFRGPNTKVTTFKDQPLAESNCESCGECMIRCPVGALTPGVTEQPEREVKTTCPYCGVGCGFYLGVKDGKTVSVRGDVDNPVNKGRLCVKGRFGYDFVNSPERLTTPLIKKNGSFVKASWEEAFDVIKSEFSKYKGEQFATLSSAKCTDEENYIIQKFTRAVMKSNHIDHCARLCHAPSVAGLAQSFGSGAMTNSIGEIKNAACILAIGTNTTAAHPVIGLEIKQAAVRGAKLIVANPKRIELVRFADIFLQHRPGTDVALLMGMMRVIVDEDLLDKSFINSMCENFDEFKASLKNFDLDTVGKITDVSTKKIAKAAKMYAENSPAGIFYAMGITQHTHGTDNVLATSNLALLTGNIGKPSTGVNPLRGQNNVQGACDMAALPNVYPGYQKVADPESRKKFENAWGCDLPAEPGLTHVELFDAICDGKIKAMYLVGENPILSEANSKHVKEALEKIDFLVVQDIFLSETAEFADVVLPAASFAEKDGTFTNTERRIQRVRKAIEPVGEARPDWQITCEIANRLGGKGFDFSHPSEIMDEIASVTPSYAGINYERIEEVGLQWPCLDKEHPGTQFLHNGKFATKSGKGKFMPLEYKPSAELPDREYPFIFTTDRSIFHFHTSTMTRKVEGLDILNSRELFHINPKDAGKLGIADGDTVKVTSRRGSIKVRTRVTDICPPGVTSMTFHFAETPTNTITNSALDPVAKIPETKVCAVKVEKI